MKNRMLAGLLAVAFLGLALPARADVISFIATGAAGSGLLEGNIDPPTGETGTGGIGASGIVYNTNTNILHVDLKWGSANGYSDLSADVFKLHLHGMTADAGNAAFGQTAPLLITLSSSTSFDPSATSGGVSANYFVNEADEAGLLAGRTYINVHLTDTDTGVIRGYLIAVPEPGSVALLMLLGVAPCFRRKRCQPACQLDFQR